MPKGKAYSDSPGSVTSLEKNNYPQGRSGSKVMMKTRVGSGKSKSGGINRPTRGAGPQH
jgi:hypothetical protein